MTNAAIYARISSDRTGAGLGVERQEADCRALCERMSWDVVGVYSDNDTSAYTGKRRPEWDRLVADITSGHVDAVAAWHIDRLTRQVRELEDVIDLAERHGVKLATVHGELDLATSTGRMQARMMGVVARQSSEQASERLRRQRIQAAEAGQVHGSGRPFGYEADLVTVRGSEAAVIRECAARILAGESLASVTRDINARGIVTAWGNPWRTKALKNVLVSARVSGRREHRPRQPGVNTRPMLGEITATAVWPAIIPPEDSDRLRVLLTDPARHNRKHANVQYMLSGVLTCWNCGAALVVRRSRDTPRYGCVKQPGTSNCGRVLVTVSFADDVVRDLVLVALESDDFRQRLTARKEVDPAVRDSIVADERRLEELAEMWSDGEMSRGEWKIMRGRVEDRLDANRAKISRANGTTALSGFTGSYDDMLALWEERNTSQRRAIVTAVLDRVVVHPSRRKFDVGRFKPVWRV